MEAEIIAELIPTIIYQLPSFAGLVYALVVVSQHNRRLLALVEHLCTSCDCSDNDTSDGG